MKRTRFASSFRVSPRMPLKSSSVRPGGGTNPPASPELADAARDFDSETLRLGHRERLRERFLEGRADSLRDYELMELVLFAAIPRRDVKPLAKQLIVQFGSFAEVIAAPLARLREVPGIGESVATQFKIIEAAALRL